MPLRFFQRPYPSANAVLLTGPRPVLVDPGFGSDVPALVSWLHSQDTPPERLALVVNTHFDCDHAGANHALAVQYGLPVAAHALEAAMVNGCDPESCRARWLHQPVEPYCVERALTAGDAIDTGEAVWRVLHTPGHTAGHISLHAPEHGLLVAGDVFHADDVGWLDPHCPGSLQAATATMDRLAALPLAAAYSGHGGPIFDPAGALGSAQRRLSGWGETPRRMAWHGVKRVFAYALMIEDGIPDGALMAYLSSCPWFHDYAAQSFAMPDAEFAGLLLAEMLRAEAARWQDGVLRATAPFVPPSKGWSNAPTTPAQWPR